MTRARAGPIGLTLLVATIAALGTLWWVWSRDRPSVEPPDDRSAARASGGAVLDPARAAATTKLPDSPEPRRATASPADDTPAPQRSEDSGWPRLFGRVVADEKSKSAIAGATIATPKAGVFGWRLAMETLALAEGVEVATCDAEGAFELAPSVRGAFLTASAPGFGTVLVDRAWLGTSSELALEIPLAAAATLHASVIGADGRPQPGAHVRLFSRAYLAARPSGRELDRLAELAAVVDRVTDRAGEATIAGLPPLVPFDVEVWLDDELHLCIPALTIGVGRGLAREWRVSAGTVVRGRALDEAGRPVHDVEVEMSDITPDRRTTWVSPFAGTREKPARTDAGGRFVVPKVGPGTWLLATGNTLATPDADGTLPSMERVEIAWGETTADVTLPVRRGLAIRGTVVDPHGQPARAELRVSSTSSGELPYGSRDSDASGRFALGPFEGGVYDVFAVPVDGRFARSEPIRIESGRDAVVVRLRPGAVVRPKAVRTSDGEPVPARFTLISTADDAPDPDRSFVERELIDGAFRSLVPGRYDLVARTEDGWIGFVRDLPVAEGALLDDVRVVVKHGATLVVKVKGETGRMESVDVYAGSFHLAGTWIGAGTAEEFLVPAGTVRLVGQTLTSLHDSEKREHEVDLAAGERREIEWPIAK